MVSNLSTFVLLTKFLSGITAKSAQYYWIAKNLRLLVNGKINGQPPLLLSQRRKLTIDSQW